MISLEDLAPEPTRPVTADAVVRYCAALGFANSCRANYSKIPDDEFRLALSYVIHHHAVVTLLKALQRHAPEAADEIAADLWGEWEDGSGLADDLVSAVYDSGIDPVAIHNVAAPPA